MKLVKSQTGFTLLHTLLLLLILGVISFAGWKVYDVNKTTNPPTSSTAPTTNNTTMTDMTEYQNQDLGFKFSYPKAWGVASIKQGDLVLPAHGDYQQVTFDKKPEVDINFVTGGASSPLDGCPEPVYMQKHELALHRATLTGWDGMDSILSYDFDYVATVNNNAAVYNENKHTSVVNGKNVWTKISSNGKALAFQWVYTEPIKAGESCGDTITQQAADEANSYFKYVYFVRSFTNTKIKGVNATYDARTNKNDTVVNQTLVVLSSVTAL